MTFLRILPCLLSIWQWNGNHIIWFEGQLKDEDAELMGKEVFRRSVVKVNGKVIQRTLKYLEIQKVMFLRDKM